MGVILDASALLAFLHEEPVGEKVSPVLEGACIAKLYPQTRNRGLSLADRACLALALDKGWPVMTADRAWAGLDIDVEVEMIRQR